MLLSPLWKNYHVKAQVNRVGSLMSIFFTDKPVKSFDDVRDIKIWHSLHSILE